MLKQFIKKSNSIHNNFYDYSLVKYKNNKNKVQIICPIHGMFEQTPQNHTQGQGCKKCSLNRNSKLFRKSIPQLLNEFNQIHLNKYDYSLVKYKNSITRVKIICEKHGTFTQKPQKHLMGRGCPICGIITCSNKNRFTTEEFIIKAKEIHGDRYDYSLVEYEIANKKVKIICKKHGLFTQTPSKHLFCSRGCPICKASKGELKVFNYLKKHKISFESQYSFKDCKNIQILYFDFYLPEQNLCVEYDGIQHFKPIKQFGGNDGFKSNQLRDKIKNDYCNENDIKLLRIKYDEDVIKKLESYIYI